MKDLRLISSLGACILALSLTLAACGGGGSSDTGGGTPAVEKPAITTPPASQSVVTGRSATFTVTATGGAPLAYQWKKNGADISGANASTYTTPATSMGDSGAVFAVAVSNSAGTATSSDARLTVTAAPMAPAITKQPEAITVTVGQTASFTVEATGTSPNFQWKKGDSDIPGANSSTYTTPATSLADSGTKYSVVVSNDLGTVTSNDASLTVTVKPAITTQPVSQVVATGQTASFSVAATGTEPLAYQWKKDGSDIAGATSSTYKPVSSGELNGAKFSVVVTNSAGTVTSNEAVLSDVAIGTEPTNQTAYTGQTATFSVTASGTGLAYQWKKNGTDISGATNSSYTTPAATSADIGTALAYSVVVSNSAGTVTSTSATLTVSARYSQIAKTGGFYDKTECVKDNSTGLVWEGKTASPATTRLGTTTYTNFDGTGVGQKLGGGNADPVTEINVIGNSIGYKTSVNTSALCGYTDWRLPTKEELAGIVASSGSPRIDITWFPDTQENFYWSSSPSVSESDNVWSDNAWSVSFYNGDVSDFYRYYGNIAVRLVRASQ